MNIPAKNILLTGRIFLLASALLFAGTLYYASGALSYKDNTVETEGTIAGYTQKDTTGSDGKTITDYYPVIEYKDTRGNSFRVNTDTAMNDLVASFIKSAGQGTGNNTLPTVKIRYLKNNPGEAGPAGTFLDLWGPALAYAALALFFSITGTTLMQLAEPGDKKK